MESILLVIDNMEFGGGERVFVQLAAGLRGRYRVFVAAMPSGRFEQRVKELGIRFYPVDMSRRLSLKPIRQIKEIIRNNKIDLVHSQGARADFFARIAGRIAGVPHILCTIAMPVEGFDVGLLQKKIYRFIDQLTERYVERFIVVSDSLRQVLIERRGIAAHRVVRIYNGIELDEYKPNGKEGRRQKAEVRREFGLSKDVPVMGTIGRMVWQKGFEYLIECVPEIVRTYPDAKILIVGDGPLKDKLKVKSEKLKVADKIIFTGFRSDIKEILSAIDILVTPSLLEGFPMVILEAMAMAKPIVATNIDGITEQITDGVNGILVPPKDPSALAKTVVRVLNDKELARTMGLSAREKVKQEFSVEKMVAETEKVYLSLLKAG
ncbi:MAG: glycosyltransferase family 4 protein [Proteobacteria bacterium]|nr:glycosyltransferase family 4 protein [Pseudomonadota bacterium]